MWNDSLYNSFSTKKPKPKTTQLRINYFRIPRTSISFPKTVRTIKKRILASRNNLNLTHIIWAICVMAWDLYAFQMKSIVLIGFKSLSCGGCPAAGLIPWPSIFTVRELTNLIALLSNKLFKYDAKSYRQLQQKWILKMYYFEIKRCLCVKRKFPTVRTDRNVTITKTEIKMKISNILIKDYLQQMDPHPV